MDTELEKLGERLAALEAEMNARLMTLYPKGSDVQVMLKHGQVNPTYGTVPKGLLDFIYSADLYSVLMEAQNNLSSPALPSMANKAIRRLDALKEALRDVLDWDAKGKAISFATPLPQVSGQSDLPRWIDDAKGKDPFTDDLIAEIERLRASLPGVPQAASESLSTLKPFAYCVLDGVDREYNTIDEFSGGRSNGIELYTAAQVQAILDERRSAAVPQAVAVPEELRRIGELIRTQDDECTANPLFVVEQERHVTGIDTDYDLPIAWCVEDCMFIEGEDEFAALEAAYQADGTVPEDHTRTGYTTHWDFVTLFFTREDAERFVQQHGHKYAGPLRMTIETEPRNKQMKLIRDWLASLAAIPTTPSGEA